MVLHIKRNHQDQITPGSSASSLLVGKEQGISSLPPEICGKIKPIYGLNKDDIQQRQQQADGKGKAKMKRFFTCPNSADGCMMISSYKGDMKRHYIVVHRGK